MGRVLAPNLKYYHLQRSRIHHRSGEVVQEALITGFMPPWHGGSPDGSLDRHPHG